MRAVVSGSCRPEHHTAALAAGRAAQTVTMVVTAERG
jgi:hypothetical protein